MGSQIDITRALAAANADPAAAFSEYDPNPEKSAEYLAEKAAAEREAAATNAPSAPSEAVPLREPFAAHKA